MSWLDLFFSTAVLSLTGMALIQLIRYFRHWGSDPSVSVGTVGDAETEAPARPVKTSVGAVRHLDNQYRLNKIEAVQYHRERSRLTATEVLQTQRDYLLQDLRDLELDHRMHKIDDADYRRDRARLNPKAVAILKELANRQDEALEHDV